MRIGIDLGGTKIEGVALEQTGSVLARRRVATPRDGGYAAILRAVIDLVHAVEREGGASPGSKTPVGVGIPGTVRRSTGRVKNANTTCLIGEPLAEDLAAGLQRPVRVANDANCFAVAEARAGAGKGARVVFGVILGTGVGGGVVIDGVARLGQHGIAGEWGHSPIHDPDGVPAPPCYCGQAGCIETRLSGPAFEADHARLAGLEDGDAAPTAPEIERLAQAGDPAAEGAVRRYLGFFGEGLARVLHVLDPDVVVLGGGMANMDLLYTRGVAAIEQVLFSPSLETPIRKFELGDSAGVFGAAWLWDEAPPRAAR